MQFSFRTRPFLGASVALLCALAVHAQRQDGPPRLVLQALDADHDGKLSATEIQAAPKTLLTLDRNGDGQLSAAELQPRPENAGATPDELVSQLMAFDRNGDGFLTPDELPARMQSLFERGDGNHDGKLTPDEIRAMATRQAMPTGPAAPGGSANFMRSDPILNALDADHDGIISASEIASAAQLLLSLDKNGDGEITPNEMRPRQQTAEERVDHLLDEWDTNKDGRIAKAEAPDRMQQQFESIDLNHDGLLDKDELLVYFNNMGNGGRDPSPRLAQRPAPAASSTQSPKGEHQ